MKRWKRCNWKKATTVRETRVPLLRTKMREKVVGRLLAKAKKDKQVNPFNGIHNPILTLATRN